MSNGIPPIVVTDTLVPPMPEFPFLLPPPPRPHPTPLPTHGRVKLLSRRNLVSEANDLSDEEAEVDDALLAVRNRGAAFLIPLGKRHTLMEERADDVGGSDGGSSSGEGTEHDSQGEDGEGEGEEEEEEQDLDASMENLDDEDDEDEDEDGEEEGEEEDDEDPDDEASGSFDSAEPEIRNQRRI